HPDVGVPVRHRTEAGPGVEVYARQAERRRNQRARLPAVGPEGLAVLVQDGVEAPGTPAREHFLDGRLVDAEKIGEGLEVWSEREDDADVEVAIGPAIQALADARRKGIVDLRVAQRALRAERLDLARLIEFAGQTHYRVQLEQRKRSRWIVEVNLARLDLPLQVLRQRVRVDLQTYRERGLRAHSGADAAVLCPRDGFVQLQGVAEESFRAEGVEAEDLPALIDRAAGVLVDLTIDFG